MSSLNKLKTNQKEIDKKRAQYAGEIHSLENDANRTEAESLLLTAYKSDYFLPHIPAIRDSFSCDTASLSQLDKERINSLKILSAVNDIVDKLTYLLEERKTLEKKQQTQGLYNTYIENYKLALLNKPDTFLYAERMAELESINEKTDDEKYELTLLNNPITRPFTQRFFELKSKDYLTAYELLELQYLSKEKTRPYATLWAQLATIRPEDRSEANNRLEELLLKGAVNAEEVSILESLDNLRTREAKLLFDDYSAILAHLSMGTSIEVHKKIEKNSYIPNVSCVDLDYADSSYFDKVKDVDQVKFETIKSAFGSAAEEITLTDFKQAPKARNDPGLFKSFSCLSRENGFYQFKFNKNKYLLAETLSKYFVDKGMEFSQPALDKIIVTLRDKINTHQLTFFPITSHKDLESLVTRELRHINFEPERKQHRPW